MKSKIRVGIIFGGRSAEHEVSLQSARNVYEALDKSLYESVLMYITKDGTWKIGAKEFLLTSHKTSRLPATIQKKELAISLLPQQDDLKQIDVIFPVLHGTFGEDGTIQGLLKLAGIPFVGADVLGSAIGMDKDVMKRLLQQANIPVAKYKVVNKNDIKNIHYDEIINDLGTTLFVKPANLGSSIGVQKTDDESKFNDALKNAFQYDNKVLIEEALNVREIECAVLGNSNPIASLPGEIIPHHSFYSYEAKYIDPNGADTIIPANIPLDVQKKIQKLAIQTFQVLCCQGMARVDFFLSENNNIFVNEINTIPGFTSISMYPKMWEASGISYTNLISKLIDLAVERYNQNTRLKTSFV